jgi:4-hydroxy-tetrahydrodipicolinate synthase
MLFRGSGVALVTPFNENGIDLDQLRSLIEWHIEAKTDALIIMGTTGEGAVLNDEEKTVLLEKAIKIGKGRIVMVANTGTNDTRASIQWSLKAQAMGYDGLLMVCPYYNKPTQRGLIAHFTAIADAVNIPIILYNVPGRTSVNLSAQSCIHLAKHPNIVGVKEASHDLNQIKAIIDGTEDFAVYSGNDDQNFDILKLGGQGFISVTGNLIPKQLRSLSDAYFGDDLLSAERIQNSLAALNDVLFIESNPVPIKTALNHIGKNVGSCRLPLVDLEVQNHTKLIEVMIASGVCDT